MLFELLFLTIVSLIGYVYFLGKSNERYWKKRGVTFHAKNKIFGPSWDFMLGDRANFEVIGDVYKKYPDEPCVGLGTFNDPVILVRDFENIRHVLQVNSNAFYNRGLDVEAKGRLSDSILFMDGKRWKLMRQNMTPLFSVVKLKNMYNVMDKSAQDFVTYLKNDPEKLKGKAFDTLCTFCSAAIGASVFGITTKSVFDSPFLHMAQNAIVSNTWTHFRFALLNLSPWLFKTLRLTLFSEHEKFFVGAIKQMIQQRKEEGGSNHDFGEMCVNLQKKGEIKDNVSGLTIEPTDELLAAQAFFFFFAGVEPSATVMFCTLIELGRNPDILERVHNEIDNVFEKYNNNLTYESLSEMKYLDMVMNESMRLLPPIGVLGRQCVQDSVLPVGNIKIDRGTKILISTFEVQRDPKVFPEPDKFIPERFSRESEKVADETFMPFGRGNRICIGERFAKIQVVTGFMYLLRHYTVKTHIQGSKIKFTKLPFALRPSNADVEFIPRKIKSI